MSQVVDAYYKLVDKGRKSVQFALSQEDGIRSALLWQSTTFWTNTMFEVLAQQRMKSSKDWKSMSTFEQVRDAGQGCMGGGLQGAPPCSLARTLLALPFLMPWPSPALRRLPLVRLRPPLVQENEKQDEQRLAIQQLRSIVPQMLNFGGLTVDEVDAFLEDMQR